MTNAMSEASPYTEEEKNEINKKFRAILTILKNAKKYLMLSNEEKAELDKYDREEGFVYRIAPNVKREFFQFSMENANKSVPIHIIAEQYSKWADELFAMIVNNANYDYGKKIHNHMIETYNVVSTVQNILEHNKHPDETEEEGDNDDHLPPFIPPTA